MAKNKYRIVKQELLNQKTTYIPQVLETGFFGLIKTWCNFRDGFNTLVFNDLEEAKEFIFKQKYGNIKDKTYLYF